MSTNSSIFSLSSKVDLAENPIKYTKDETPEAEAEAEAEASEASEASPEDVMLDKIHQQLDLSQYNNFMSNFITCTDIISYILKSLYPFLHYDIIVVMKDICNNIQELLLHQEKPNIVDKSEVVEIENKYRDEVLGIFGNIDIFNLENIEKLSNYFISLKEQESEEQNGLTFPSRMNISGVPGSSTVPGKNKGLIDVISDFKTQIDIKNSDDINLDTIFMIPMILKLLKLLRSLKMFMMYYDEINEIIISIVNYIYNIRKILIKQSSETEDLLGNLDPDIIKKTEFFILLEKGERYLLNYAIQYGITINENTIRDLFREVFNIEDTDTDRLDIIIRKFFEKNDELDEEVDVKFQGYDLSSNVNNKLQNYFHQCRTLNNMIDEGIKKIREITELGDIGSNKYNIYIKILKYTVNYLVLSLKAKAKKEIEEIEIEEIEELRMEDETRETDEEKRERLEQQRKQAASAAVARRVANEETGASVEQQKQEAAEGGAAGAAEEQEASEEEKNYF